MVSAPHPHYHLPLLHSLRVLKLAKRNYTTCCRSFFAQANLRCPVAAAILARLDRAIVGHAELKHGVMLGLLARHWPSNLVPPHLQASAEDKRIRTEPLQPLNQKL